MDSSEPGSISCPRCGVRLRKPSEAELAQARCPACDAPLAPPPAETIAWPGPGGTTVGPNAVPGLGPAFPPVAPRPNIPGMSLELGEDHARGFKVRKSRFAGLGMIFSAISLLVLSSAVVVSLYLRMFHPQMFEPPVNEDQMGVRVIRGDYSAPAKWTDAATASVRVGGLRVKIDRVEIGPVVAKGGDLDIVESDADVIQIYLELKNESDQEIDYVSWYGNEFEVGGKVVYAKLSQDSKELPMLVFEDAAGVYGHVPRALIRPKETVLDSMIFEIGEGANSRTGPWRLELPQAAFGFQGSLGFEIDERAIRQVSPLESPPVESEGMSEEDAKL